MGVARAPRSQAHRAPRTEVEGASRRGFRGETLYCTSLHSLCSELRTPLRSSYVAPGILDAVCINMPFMDGFEVTEKLENCKVIIITAYDSFAYAQRALRLGACDILAKPIDFGQLQAAIERTMGWQDTQNEWVNEVIAYIYEHYNEQLDLRSLAGIACVSESHLARGFKKATGSTIISFVHKVRIEKSIHFMTVEKCSIRAAMEQVGYQSQNQFYKYFVKETGQTPAVHLQGR